MSGLLVLRDGNEVPISQHLYDNLIPQLRMKAGLKMWKSPESGDYIVLSNSNLLMVKYVPEEQEPVKEPEPVVEEKAKPVEEVKEEPKEEESQQEREDQLMATLVERSNCKHEPEKLELYSQATAKGVRYFPVCSFCGKRERYVSEKKITDGSYAGTPNEKWTESDITMAKPWVER